MNRLLRFSLLAAIPVVIFFLQLRVEDGRVWAVIVGAVVVPVLVQLFLLLRARKGLREWYRETFPPRENPASILLGKVRGSWVGEYLHKTIASGDLGIEFDFQSLDGTRTGENPPKRGRRASAARGQPESERQLLEGVLARSGHRLLITGEPGGGKTVMMLKLTELLADAAASQLRCIPLVLNFSTWRLGTGVADSGDETFREWVVRQLRVKYQVEKSDADQMLDNNQLVLVLDGLDEVGGPADQADGADSAARLAGIQRVVDCFNEYAAPLIGDDVDTPNRLRYVVTCRFATYERLARKPLVHGRIHLRELTRRQVIERVEGTGRNPELLRVLRGSPELVETARNPYLLNVMIRTLVKENSYSVESISQLLASRRLRRDLLSAYVALEASPRHSDRWGNLPRLTAWLSTVAYLTGRVGEFLVEEMQPSLLRGRWRWVYRALFLAAVTLFVVVAVAVPMSAALGVEWAHHYNRTEGMRRAVDSFLWSLLVLAVGIPLAFGAGSMVDAPPHQPGGWWSRTRVGTILSTAWHNGGLRFALLLGLVLGAMRGLVIHASYEMTTEAAISNFALTFLACTFAFAWTTGAGLVHENMDRVTLADAPSWAKSRMIYGAVAGLGFGVILVAAVAIQALAAGEWENPRLVIARAGSFALTLTICLPLLFGLTGATTHPSRKTRPNHGIWQMARKAGLSYVVLTAVGFGGLYFGYGAFMPPPNGIVNAILGLCFGVLALAFGLLGVIRHVCLRLVLAWSGDLPLDLVSFLQHTSRIGLTRAVGGRFLFEHTDLQAHFAEQAAAARRRGSALLPAAMADAAPVVAIA